MEKILWSRATRGRERNLAGEKKSAGGGAFGDLGLGAGAAEVAGQRNNCPRDTPGAGYMRRPWGHRTLLMWHQTRPVTTGLMRREVCKTASHPTMATGRWL